ncbi:MAG TPA: hypothetical protein VL866_24395 [Pyrinomonadaceae bacterium]|nr:hypothetical protein [Pyrinomonadaceae bacterium]
MADEYEEVLAGTLSLGYLDCTLLEYARGIKYFVDEESRKPNCDTHLINLLRRAACVGWENIHLFQQSPIATTVNERDALLAEVGRLREALVKAAIPYEALLADAESRKWIAPEVWAAIEAAVIESRAALSGKVGEGNG